jgi:hypothetical protein
MLRDAPLCRHEVALLVARAEDFGDWYPNTMVQFCDDSGNYPPESVTPKFHRLVCRVPEFVRQWERWAVNVGSTSECAVEHTHGLIAKLFNARDHMPPDQQAASAMGALSTAQCPSAPMETPRKCKACNAPLKGQMGTHSCARRPRPSSAKKGK